MSGVVPVVPRFKFTDANGNPLANGSVTVYLAGTTTLANTYQDKTLSTANTNPVNLDGNGECLFWVDGANEYKFLLTTGLNGTGSTVSGWPVDNIPASAVVNFLQSGTGAVSRTAQDKARDVVSVKDFGAIGDGTSHALSSRYGTLAAAQAVYPFVTSLTQEIDTTAADAALQYLQTIGGGTLVFPPSSGAYIFKRPQVGSQRGIYVPSNVCISAYGATLEMQENASFFAVKPQTTVETITITSDVALNDTTFAVSGGVGTLAAGDLVFVRLNTSVYDAFEPANWYWAKVTAASGTSVTLDRPAPAAMVVASTTSGNRAIVKAADVSNVTIEGAYFKCTLSAVVAQVESCVNAQYVHGLTVRDCKALNCGSGIVNAQFSENVRVYGISAPDGIRAETASKGRLMSFAECDGVDASNVLARNFAASSAAIVVEASCVNVNFRNVVADVDGTGGSGDRRYVFSSLGQGPFSVEGLTIRGKNVYPSTGSNFIGQPRMRNVHVWAQYTLAGGSGPVQDDLMLNGVQYTRRTVSVRVAIPTTASNTIVELPSGRFLRARILTTATTGLTNVFLRRDSTNTNNGVSLKPGSINTAVETNFDYVDVSSAGRNFNDDKQILVGGDGSAAAGKFVYFQLEMLMRDGLNEDAGTSMLTYIDA